MSEEISCFQVIYNIFFFGGGEEASPVLKALHRGLEIKVSYFLSKNLQFFSKNGSRTKKRGTGPEFSESGSETMFLTGEIYRIYYYFFNHQRQINCICEIVNLLIFVLN
jgi:hypothetical protein